MLQALIHTADPIDSILEELLEVGASEGGGGDSPLASSPAANPAQPDPDRLVREAAQGHLDMVRLIISKHPDKVSTLHTIIIIILFIYRA